MRQLQALQGSVPVTQAVAIERLAGRSLEQPDVGVGGAVGEFTEQC